LASHPGLLCFGHFALVPRGDQSALNRSGQGRASTTPVFHEPLETWNSWASNTLRIIGIVLTAGFALVASLFLFLMSMCAYGGDLNGRKHPDQVIPYLVAGIAVMGTGVAISAFLARGIRHSPGSPVTAAPAGFSALQSPALESSAPIELSPSNQKAIAPVV